MPAKPQPEQQGFDLARLYLWVKGLESKVNNLLREVDVLKNDFIRKNGDLRKTTKVINDDLVELRHEQEQLLQKMDLVIKELKQTAGREEVEVLKKYLEYWNPLNFVTQRDLELAVQSQAEKNKNSSAFSAQKGDE